MTTTSQKLADQRHAIAELKDYIVRKQGWPLPKLSYNSQVARNGTGDYTVSFSPSEGANIPLGYAIAAGLFLFTLGLGGGTLVGLAFAEQVL